MPRLLCCVLTLVVATAAAPVAPVAADVISPEEGSCRGKAAGAACDVDGKAGHCQASTCGRLDYSQGTPPRSVEEPCQVCVPGPAKGSERSGAKGKGCAVDGGQGAAGGALLGLALLALARRRRS
jgi:MYXO-CTERM domain-containing protein